MNQPERNFSILVYSQYLNSSGLLDLIGKEAKYTLFIADTIENANEVLLKQPLDLLVLDWDAADFSSMDMVVKARNFDPDILVILITDDAQREDVKLWNLGIDDCIIKPLGPNEFIKRIDRALNLRQLKLRCFELAHENKQLFELAVTDSLTKLVNRRYFNERLVQEFQRVKRFGGLLSLLLIDIDHFKRVNDEYGHLAGDRILMEVARLIREALRSIDLAGRYGGEEFIILLPETPLNGALIVAEKLRSIIDKQSFRAVVGDKLPQGIEIPDHITVSIGIAGIPHKDVHQPEDLVNMADTALYIAKQNGRNRVELFNNK